VSDPDRPTSPGRGVWIAWSLALVGGLAVLGAVALALLHPCLQDGRALVSESCDGTSAPALVIALTTGGTLLAVVGGLAATLLTVRRTRR
jgi:hypothetical protein